MAATRVQKQWPLTKNETITSFEAWRQNLQYTLRTISSDCFTWLKKTSATRVRGVQNDSEEVAENIRSTAEQKSTHLE